MENFFIYFWIAAFVALLVVEALTMGLTTIWFAGGALIAFILATASVPLPFQVVAFFLVSILLLCFTRPVAKKMLNGKKYGTNYDGIIGKVAKVTEMIDNYNATGTVAVNGQEWSARSDDDEIKYEPGTLVKVLTISGVKVIVTKYIDE